MMNYQPTPRSKLEIFHHCSSILCFLDGVYILSQYVIHLFFYILRAFNFKKFIVHNFSITSRNPNFGINLRGMPDLMWNIYSCKGNTTIIYSIRCAICIFWCRNSGLMALFIKYWSLYINLLCDKMWHFS